MGKRTESNQPSPRAAAEDGPSLRSWLRQLDLAGQLRRIKAEVDWDQEIGALARITMALGGPALLFETIKDHRHTRCTKFLTASMSNKTQVCLMLGLSPETGDRDIVRHCKEVFRKPIKPISQIYSITCCNHDKSCPWNY